MSRIAIATLLVTLLTGCNALSPISALTKLDLTLAAGERLNPDLHGRPSPVVVRLIELRHPVAFEHSDFFSLYERAEQVLPKDWVSSEELALHPGERRLLKLSVAPQSRYVGVLAAYRDLPHVQWRWVVPLAQERRTQVDLVLDEMGVRQVGAGEDGHAGG